MQATQQITDAITSPYWQFDKRSGRYRDKSTGRYLSQSSLETLQRRHINQVEKDIQVIGDLLLSGKISLATFQEAMGKSLKTLHLHQMLIGRGGINQATSSDYLAVGRQLRQEYSWLRNFAIDINRGYSISEKGQQVPLTEARFRARLKLYAKAGRVSFQTGQQEVAKSQGKYFMWRTLGVAEHCADCLRYAAMGIQPIGVLPLPGVACACRANCRCSVRYFSSIQQALEFNKSILGSSAGFS